MCNELLKGINEKLYVLILTLSLGNPGNVLGS